MFCYLLYLLPISGPSVAEWPRVSHFPFRRGGRLMYGAIILVLRSINSADWTNKWLSNIQVIPSVPRIGGLQYRLFFPIVTLQGLRKVIQTKTLLPRLALPAYCIDCASEPITKCKMILWNKSKLDENIFMITSGNNASKNERLLHFQPVGSWVFPAPRECWCCPRAVDR